MAEFTLKSFQQILSDMIATVGANSALTDISAGSAVITMLEAASTEDANSYIQMLNIIRSYNLDTVVGIDLDDRAYEYGLTRIGSNPANGYVTLSDSAFSKVSTVIYPGLPGPSAGNTTVNIVDSTSFPAIGGSVIVGRGTNNVETVPYGSITNMGTYYRLNLTLALTKDHGTDETIIFAQGGDRVVPAGSVVYVPESDLISQINFILQADQTILDGEVSILNSTVICSQSGTVGNVNIGAIRFYSTLPFTTAEVTNPYSFSTGRDVETDEQLRDRIRATIQSLSRGTEKSVLTAAVQVTSSYQNNKVVSASFVEATTLNELNFLYIDDGVALEPWFVAEPYQLLMEYAAGGEKFLQLDNSKTPLTKGSLVTQNSEPFGIIAGQTLIIRVGGIEETTVTFGGADMFAVPGSATAEEVIRVLNDEVSFIEARTSGNRTKVVIEALANTNEEIQVVGGTANVALGFKEGVDVYTLKLYKNDILLSKDGWNAYVISQSGQPFAIVPATTLTLKIDDKPTVQTITFGTETTAAEVAALINTQITGARAYTIQIGSSVRVVIVSTNPYPGQSAVEVTGGAANAILNFSTTIVYGAAKDYSLNKYNGQIELEDVLVAGDEVVAGSPYTRAFEESISAQNYSVVIGQLLILQVDDIVDSSVTTQINVTDFIDVSLAATYVDDHFEDLYVRFKSTTTTVALQGVYRQISAYNGTTGQFTTAAFPAIPQVADVYEVVQIATATATASLDCDGVNTMFEPLLRGVSFYGKTKNLDTFLRVQSNSQDESGRIRIHSATTVVGLDLPTGVTNSAQESNYGFVESGNEQDFTFGVGQFIIFVFDNDLTYKTVTVNIDYDSIVTAGVGASDFRAASLITYFTQQDFFVGCRVRFKFNTTTAALRNQIGTITAYDETNGQITVAAPLPAAPVIGDTFEIIPTTTRNVVDLFNHRTFTNLGVYCDIEASYDGTKVQLTTKTEGTLGAVRCAGGNANDFSIPLLTDGTLLGASTVDSIEGLSVGLQLVINDSGVVGPADITITNIAGAASPYTVSVSVDAGGTDISGYLTGNSAYFMPRNQFDFTLIPAEGIDGYKNYVGLVQECQWIIDGKDTDFENYPGIKAAGVQIEIKAPVMHYVEVTIDVSTSDGLTLALVKNDVKSAISNYINGLGVGEDVVLSEIIAAVMAVTGIVDSSILTPTANVLIAANELARISETDIIVG